MGQLHGERLVAFHREWSDRVGAIDFECLGVEGRIDHVHRLPWRFLEPSPAP